MASPGQCRGACGHVMALFDKHNRCARYRDKGHGDDACVRKQPCEYCNLLTPEQAAELSTPTYKLQKEMQKELESLVDPAAVTVLSPVDNENSNNTSEDLSLPQLSIRKELQEMDEI